MPNFSFDAKAFLALHIQAPDEAAARAFAERLVESVRGAAGADGRPVAGHVHAVRMDGEADLIAVGGGV